QAARISRMSRDGCREIGPPAPPNLLGFRRFHRDKGERCRRVFGPKTEVPNRRASDPKKAGRRTPGLQPDPCAGEALPENRHGPLKRQGLCASPGFALLPNCPPLTRRGTFFWRQRTAVVRENSRCSRLSNIFRPPEGARTRSRVSHCPAWKPQDFIE